MCFDFELFVRTFWLQIVLVLSALPGFTLLVRGLVWGSDSFAYWGYSCGFNVVLNDSNVFLFFVKNIVNCNLVSLTLITTFIYFLVLISVYFFGKKWFKEKSYLLPIYFSCLTPLIFIEVLRFENDFFGWSLAFVSIGCFSLWKEKNNPLTLLLSGCLALFSLQLWTPSIFILAFAVFLLELSLLEQYMVLCLGGILALTQYWGYILGSFTNGIGLNAVSEEIPLVGLVFILHVLHFYKKIPFPLIYYGWFLICLGALKSKYMFLAVLPLIMGLLWKELHEGGLSISKLGINNIPVLGFCLLLSIGWFFMGLNMYPTQQDMKEMQNAIQSAKDLNEPLYNDWGDGWTFVSLGFDTNYKISPPQPDWNNLTRPFVAWSREELIGCSKKGKYTQKCN